MIVVIGNGRCGLTLTMQMLDAGGCPVYGEWPAYEPFEPYRIPWGELAPSHAVKVVDPVELGFPPGHDHSVIVLKRDFSEQAKSGFKFAGARYNRRERMRAIAGLRKDQATIERWARGQRKHIVVRFERIIEDPGYAAVRMGRMVGWALDIHAMERCVEPRSSRCLPFLLELRQLRDLRRMRRSGRAMGEPR